MQALLSMLDQQAAQDYLIKAVYMYCSIAENTIIPKVWGLSPGLCTGKVNARMHGFHSFMAGRMTGRLCTTWQSEHSA
jgi:hypothetical protein